CLLEDGSALVAEFGGNRVQHVELPGGAALGVYGQAGRGGGRAGGAGGVAGGGEAGDRAGSGEKRGGGVLGPRGREGVTGEAEGLFSSAFRARRFGRGSRMTPTLASIHLGPIQFDTPVWLLLIPVLWGLALLIGRKSLSGGGTVTRWVALAIRLIVIALLV